MSNDCSMFVSSPFYSDGDKIDYLMGAVNFRDKIISNLRQQLKNIEDGKPRYCHIREVEQNGNNYQAIR
jgi:hypothetical protein